jgi:hypothetical protein
VSGVTAQARLHLEQAHAIHERALTCRLGGECQIISRQRLVEQMQFRRAHSPFEFNQFRVLARGAGLPDRLNSQFGKDCERLHQIAAQPTFLGGQEGCFLNRHDPPPGPRTVGQREKRLS